MPCYPDYTESDKRFDEWCDKMLKKMETPENPNGYIEHIYTSTNPKVNHPPHYAQGRKYEPIAVITDWGLNFNLGNVVKYISRAGRKGDTLEDLKKAKWYLDHEIERLQGKDETDCGFA